MMIRNILIITVIAALVPTAMSNVSASAGSEIALFSGVSDSDGLSISSNGDTAKMELKVTNENGKTTKVSDFQMNADNVLYIKVGDKVTVNDNVDFTKAIATDGNNNQKAIGITSNGVIDFTGYAQGVSTLDVVVDDDRAYEAIIVIGQQPPEVINKQVTKVNNNQETRVQFVYPDNDNDNNNDNDNKKKLECQPEDEFCEPGCEREDMICGKSLPRDEIPYLYNNENNNGKEFPDCNKDQTNMPCYDREFSEKHGKESQDELVPAPEAGPLCEDIGRNGECIGPLTSNCGGIPCTATEKEDSWLDDDTEYETGDEDGEEEPEVDERDAEVESGGDEESAGDDESIGDEGESEEDSGEESEGESEQENEGGN
jgi:hypothetical protein